MKNRSTMNLAVGSILVLAVLIIGTEPSRAESPEMVIEPLPQMEDVDEERVTETATGPMSTMFLGKITAIEGALYTVEEEEVGPRRVQVTRDTVTDGPLKVGDSIAVALLPNGEASVITNMATQGEGIPLGPSHTGSQE